MSFEITAIASRTVDDLRDDIAAGRRPARRVTLDEAGAPCRHCLMEGAVGDEMLLLTYEPFTGTSPYAVPSPIYLHADQCVRYAAAGEIPDLVRSGLRAVRSYDAAHDLIEGEVVEGTTVESSIRRLLDDERAAYIHIYSATAGCFTCRVDRS